MLPQLSYLLLITEGARLGCVSTIAGVTDGLLINFCDQKRTPVSRILSCLDWYNSGITQLKMIGFI